MATTKVNTVSKTLYESHDPEGKHEYNINLIKEGYIIQLHLNFHDCKAVVQDQRFLGLNPTVLPVRFMKGYSLSMFVEQSKAWQQRHIQLMQVQSTLGMTRVVYIGKLGLLGGGGSNSSSHSCNTVYCCSICNFRCPNDACYACCIHKNHPCAERVREQQQERMRQQRERERQEQMRQQRERERQEQMRQQRERERQEQMRQQREREQQEQIRQQRERQRQEWIRRQEREQRELIRQQREKQEKERQAVLSKLDQSLASAPITKEDSANLIQEELSINLKDQTIQHQDAYVFVHEGTILEDWDDETPSLTYCIKRNSSFNFNDIGNKENYNMDDESQLPFENALVQRAATPYKSSSSISSTDDESEIKDSSIFSEETAIHYFSSDSISSLDSTGAKKCYRTSEKSSKLVNTKHPAEKMLVCTINDSNQEDSSSILVESKKTSLLHTESVYRKGKYLESYDKNIQLPCSEHDSDNSIAILEPSTGIDILDPYKVVHNLENKQDFSLTTSFLENYTTHLSEAEHTYFYQVVGKYVEDKLPDVAQDMQQTIIDFFRHEDLVPYIVQHYHPSEWIVQSLLKDIVTYQNEDAISLNRFRVQWSNIMERYQSADQIRLLKFLRLKKCIYNLSLLDISDVLDFVLQTEVSDYDVVCSEAESWLFDLKNAWLKLQIKSMFNFPDEEQHKLCSALSGMDWNMNMMQQFMKSVKNEVTLVDPVMKLLTAIKKFHAPNTIVLNTIETNPMDHETSKLKRRCKAKRRQNAKQRNKVKNKCNAKQVSTIKHWTHIINYHSMLHKIRELSLQISHSKNKPLNNLLKSKDSAKLLENTITDNLELIDFHTADFVKVLDLLYNYHVTDSICAASFSLLQQITPSNWVDAIDQEIVNKLFQSPQVYTTHELIQYITSKSSAFTPERLRSLYNSIKQSYVSHSVFLHSVSDPAFDKFKSKLIADWDRETITAWAEQVKSSTSSSKAISQCELIAGVQRAVELHNDFPPRDTQLLSLLTLLNPTVGMGRLAQVNTGEGKSLIIAMLAAIHALQGKKVDVITTSTELSIPEVKKQKPFYESLSLTVAENSDIDNKILAYKSDVLYGTAGDFQADILREEFLGNDIRCDRGFDIVIVDEVDSMLFDNRSHSVRLAEQNPGMNHLELPLGVIWEYIQRIARQMTTEDGQVFFIPEPFERCDKNIKLDSGAPWESCAIPVADKRSFITERVQIYLEKLLRDLKGEEKEEYEAFKKLNSEIKFLEEEINNTANAEEKNGKSASLKILIENLGMLPWTKRHPVLEIPVHLRSFARSQIPYWIKNALNAAYGYKKDAHYTVKNQKIVPIHYNETGVLQSSLIWSDGLTQFLQIKEGLYIDPEGISTNFISNICFFKRYGSCVYGLTGTLGGKATQDFLYKMYSTDIVIIPPYQRRKILDNADCPYLCKELVPIVLPNQGEWYKNILNHAVFHAEHKRAVLVICKFIKQVKYLAKQLSKKYDLKKITVYTGEDESFEKSTVDSGEIIIATNIAGRGTDFETSESVEAHGGMYVAITFLPQSYRVEMQNVGRTARAGKKGMAQLIIHDSVRSDIQAIKNAREEQEILATSKALDDAQKMLVEEHVFKKFCCLESEFLPTANVCELIQNWENLIAAWHEHAAEKLSSAKISLHVTQKVNDRKAELIQLSLGSLSDTEASRLTVSDRQYFLDKAARQAASEQPYFETAYKDSVLDSFCHAHANVPKELIACLKDGRTFEPDCSDLARIFNWGYYERKGFEENAGFWRKSKHFEEKDMSMVIASTMFEQEFATPAKQWALNDRLVCNPYFYVLKGNEYLVAGNLSSAIKCYDRAILMDPEFSVNARYNKAQALLLFDENKGERQEIAYVELNNAKQTISNIFIPNLLTFNTLVNQYEPKFETSQHVQFMFNLLNEIKEYIDKACNVITEAKAKKYDVKLTPHTIEEALNRSGEDHSRAIREAAINGFTNLFVIECVKPTPWWSVVGLFLIAVAQSSAGFLITACTGGSIGIGLITEGIRDMITAVKSAIRGSFDWGSWAMQKTISLTIALLSSGWKAIKDGYRDVVNTIADLTGKTAVSATKDGIKLATDAFVSNLAKETTRELLLDVAEWGTNKLIMEDIEKNIIQSVESSITEALSSNPLVIKALELDNKMKNNYWLNVFKREGLLLLEEQKEHKCMYMLREIVLGVAKNKCPDFKKSLRILGFTKMLHEVSNYTKEFISEFNSKIQSHQSDIALAAQQSELSETSTFVTSTVTNEVLSNAPPVDIDENDIIIDNAMEGTNYTSKTKPNGNTRQTLFNQKGPSTCKLLADEFKTIIARKITNSVKSNAIIPVINYGVNTLTEALFRERDEEIAALRIKVKTARDSRHCTNEAANDMTKNEKEHKKDKKMKNESDNVMTENEKEHKKEEKMKNESDNDMTENEKEHKKEEKMKNESNNDMTKNEKEHKKDEKMKNEAANNTTENMKEQEKNEKKKEVKKTTESKQSTSKSEKKSVPNESVQKGIERLKNNEPMDKNDLALIAACAKAPIYVYDKKTGKLRDIIGDKLPGKIISLQYSPGHWEPLDGNINVESSGDNNCLLDAAFSQFNPIQKKEIHNANILKQKMIEMLQNPSEATIKAYEMRDQLVTIAPDELRRGGGWIAEGIKAFMAVDRYIATRPKIEDLINYVKNNMVVGFDSPIVEEKIANYIQEMDPDVTREEAIWAAHHLLVTTDFAVNIFPSGVLRKAGSKVMKGIGKFGKLFKMAKRVISSKGRIRIHPNRSQRKHIFRNREGHFSEETPENVKLLEDIANDPKCKVGKLNNGITDYARIGEDGVQYWVRVREGQIINGGFNKVPREFHPETGLFRRHPPNQK